MTISLMGLGITIETIMGQIHEGLSRWDELKMKVTL